MRKLTPIVIALVLMALASCGDDEGSPFTSPADSVLPSTSTDTAPQTTEQVTTTQVATTSTQAPTTTTNPPSTTTTEPPFDPIHLSGSGDDVVDLAIPGGDPAILQISYGGSSNFAVWTYTASGDPIDLLVNTIGAYQGVRLVNLSDDRVAFLEVTASSGWTITAAPVINADRIPANGSASGRGDNILIDPSASSSAARATLTHDGDSNFAIWVYSPTDADLLVNEIGAYNGTVLVIAGGFLWDVVADGNWTIEVER